MFVKDSLQEAKGARSRHPGISPAVQERYGTPVRISQLLAVSVPVSPSQSSGLPGPPSSRSLAGPARSVSTPSPAARRSLPPIVPTEAEPAKFTLSANSVSFPPRPTRVSLPAAVTVPSAELSPKRKSSARPPMSRSLPAPLALPGALWSPRAKKPPSAPRSRRSSPPLPLALPPSLSPMSASRPGPPLELVVAGALGIAGKERVRVSDQGVDAFTADQ